MGGQTERKGKQEVRLPHRDRAKRHVSKFVLCLTRYMGVAIVPFDRPHTISY